MSPGSRVVETVTECIPALPQMALGLATAAIVAGALFGWHPLWPADTETLAEAAALGNRATIMALVARGADPNARYSVRPGILRSDPIELTPLEAAITTRQDYLFEFIRSQGAVVNAGNRLRLFCFASALGADAIARSLAEVPLTDSGCDGVELPLR
ncbi:MAG: hypothetical protein AB1806_18105 [Acidobacteriota bacterium]